MNAHTPSPTRHSHSVDWAGIGGGFLVLIAGCAAYRNSFSGPLVFDDLGSIADNPTLRHLGAIGSVLSPPSGLTVSGRPVLNLSFALNYAISGSRVWSLHAVNLLIHLLAGLTLFGVLRRIMERIGAGPPGRRWRPLDQNSLAFAIALLWTLHPLQTEGVTYIVQRAESLMGLFYLLTLYCFIRHVERPKGRADPLGPPRPTGGPSGPALPRSALPRSEAPRSEAPRSEAPRSELSKIKWAGLSILFCVLGMATKEVMVSAPVIIFLYDRTFVSGSFREAWRRHGRLHRALMATWVLLAFLVASAGSRGGSAGFGAALPWLSYARIQCFAIVHYLQLALWPRPLVFYYGRLLEIPAFELGISAFAVAALAVGSGCLLFRRRGRDLAELDSPRPAEPETLGVPAGAQIQQPQASAAGGTAPPPENPRPQSILRRSFAGRRFGFFGETLGFAGAWFFATLAPSSSIVPVGTETLADHRMYLGLAAVLAVVVVGIVVGAGWRLGAIVLLAGAIALGTLTYARNRDYRSDLALWRDTVVKRPDNPVAHNNLGEALRRRGRFDEAVNEFEQALRINPGYADACNNFGVALSQLGRPAEAIPMFERALRLAPDDAQAELNWGSALDSSGDGMGAMVHYRQALLLNPDLVEAHFNLGLAYWRAGRLTEARDEFAETLRLKPDDSGARRNLARLEALSRERSKR